MKGKLKYRTNFLDQQQYLCEKIQNAAQQKHPCHHTMLFSSARVYSIRLVRNTPVLQSPR